MALVRAETGTERESDRESDRKRERDRESERMEIDKDAVIILTIELQHRKRDFSNEIDISIPLRKIGQC